MLKTVHWLLKALNPVSCWDIAFFSTEIMEPSRHPFNFRHSKGLKWSWGSKGDGDAFILKSSTDKYGASN